MRSQRNNIIDLFEENEKNIGRLYGIYSRTIPKRKKFWHNLALEEAGHAEDIRISYQNEAEESFVENKFTRGVIKYVMDFVAEQIVAAKEKRLSHAEALNVALRIERSILEKKCFELFTPKDTMLKKALEKMNRETDGHVKLLEEELKGLQGI